MPIPASFSLLITTGLFYLWVCFVFVIFTSLLQFFNSMYESEVKVLVTQSCPTLCNPMDCNLPGSSVHRILKARTGVGSHSHCRRSSLPRNWAQVSCIASRLFAIWATAAAAAAKSLQSCPTLCHPIEGSPPGSAVPGNLQARTLEWVAVSFSSAWKWKVKVKWLSRVRLFTTPWASAYQAPPSMGFSRQEYWSWVPLPSPREAQFHT